MKALRYSELRILVPWLYSFVRFNGTLRGKYLRTYSSADRDTDPMSRVISVCRDGSEVYFKNISKDDIHFPEIWFLESSLTISGREIADEPCWTYTETILRPQGQFFRKFWRIVSSSVVNSQDKSKLCELTTGMTQSSQVSQSVAVLTRRRLQVEKLWFITTNLLNVPVIHRWMVIHSSVQHQNVESAL